MERSFFENFHKQVNKYFYFLYKVATLAFVCDFYTLHHLLCKGILSFYGRMQYPEGLELNPPFAAVSLSICPPACPCCPDDEV